MIYWVVGIVDETRGELNSEQVSHQVTAPLRGWIVLYHLVTSSMWVSEPAALKPMLLPGHRRRFLSQVASCCWPNRGRHLDWVIFVDNGFRESHMIHHVVRILSLGRGWADWGSGSGASGVATGSLGLGLLRARNCSGCLGWGGSPRSLGHLDHWYNLAWVRVSHEGGSHHLTIWKHHIQAA